jgi:hypothetical protein
MEKGWFFLLLICHPDSLAVDNMILCLFLVPERSSFSLLTILIPLPLLRGHLSISPRMLMSST